ncbi:MULTISPECIES: APC family permease [Nocardiaceae]|uniref:Amino acid transporter n=1 Tax=Rhodococcoides corynebacterioides TaxID=53972 RepID=A0ABS2KV15_9NOCA|nr:MULTISPECIES: APC family permease [Rhodococcus]MBM7415781.1 amino acid transporter [Rhodococcus corynebacterioides]MBP1118243.1 amino acid transporter [Rhodococcus sp. PvP016]
MTTSSLRAALDQAAAAPQPSHPVYSPLSALGRKQLTQFDLLGQSLSTMAPATCMVFIALWMSTVGAGPGGLLAIIGATAVMTLVALCIRQFTVRLAASGSLYSFVAHGLGRRATLTTAAALLVGYLGVSISVLSNAGDNLMRVADVAGAGLGGGHTFVASIVVAVLVGSIALRGVRFATRTILVVELCTLAVIVVLLLQAPVTVAAETTPTSAPVGFALFLAMQTVLSLAGFESAAFFGPEARTPLRTVSRTVIVSPLLVGVLYVFAGWAGMTGHAGTLLNAYFGGVDSGASTPLVVAVNVGVCSSWIASTLGFAQAGSRLLFSMSIERIIPGALRHVGRLRTPHAAVITFVGASLIGAAWHDPDDTTSRYDVIVEFALTLGYTMVALAALRFLSRIGEHTLWTRLCGWAAAGAGSCLLLFVVLDTADSGFYLAWFVVLGGSGTVWYAVLARVRPASLRALGVFDSVGTADLLPGSADLAADADGRPVLRAPRHGR